MANRGFDLGKFHAALNAQREAKGLNWKEVAEESGVSASTLTRMSQGSGLMWMALLFCSPGQGLMRCNSCQQPMSPSRWQRFRPI